MKREVLHFSNPNFLNITLSFSFVIFVCSLLLGEDPYMTGASNCLTLLLTRWGCLIAEHVFWDCLLPQYNPVYPDWHISRVQGNPSDASIQAHSFIHHFINNEADTWISLHLTPVAMSQLVPNLTGFCVQPCKVLMTPTQSLVHMLRLMMIYIHEEVREDLLLISLRSLGRSERPHKQAH